jgi:hypothetical protein
MQDDKSRPEQTSRVTAVNSSNWRRTVIAIVITALVAGAGGYLLGIRNKQSVPPSQSSPSPQATMITQISATIIQPSNPSQSTKSFPTPTQFNPPASWRVYKSEFGYQYSYPSAWHHYPEFNAPSSGVTAPGAKYYDGKFRVERLAARECERYRRFLSEEHNPRLSMRQKEITISGYPAFQLEGWERRDDGYYDRKSVLVVREKTCYYLDITSRNNPEQLAILNQILSTFALSD